MLNLPIHISGRFLTLKQTTGRWTLVPLIICSVVLVALCFWQIIERGGANWLFGGKKECEKMQGTELREHL
jgi:hypothetical protein